MANMQNHNETKIFKYSQVYDYLRTIKFGEYLSNMRDEIHKQLYDNAIDKLIKEVNNPDTTVKIAKTIQAYLDLYNYYMLKHTPIDDYIRYVDNGMEYKYKLAAFNKDNFRFIEYKNKVWYYPSRINIIYTHSLVRNENGNFIRLNIGPLPLMELWENKYITNKDISKILKQDNTAKYIIEYIDYVAGYVVLFDKVNFNTFTVDLSLIDNINNYDFSDTYNEMFTVKHIRQKNK